MVEIDQLDQIDLPSSSSSSPESFTGKSSKTLRKSGKPYQFVPSACQVCLGKATGHHYDVASCNGCKSFFRRVTIEKLVYKCMLYNLCYENIQPGDPAPKCRSCRYKKCVEVGMNPLGIQSELRKLSESSSEENKEIVVLPRIIEPPKSIESQISDLIDHLVHLDLKTISFRDCSYNPTNVPSLKEVVKDEISIIGLGDRMGPMPGWPIAQEVMDECRRANAVPGAVKSLAPNMKRWLMYDLLTCIEMAKTFDFFRKLSESDRYFLFRDTLLMISNLTKAFFAFEKKMDKMMRPDGTHWPTPPSCPRFPQELHTKLCNDIGKRAVAGLIRMNFTKIEFLLVRAILICNAAAPDISQEARGILSVERSKYTMALLNHTMAKKGIEGPGRFAEILNIIDVLERQQKDQRDVNLLITLHRQRDIRIPLFDEVMLTC